MVYPNCAMALITNFFYPYNLAFGIMITVDSAGCKFPTLWAVYLSIQCFSSPGFIFLTGRFGGVPCLSGLVSVSGLSMTVVSFLISYYVPGDGLGVPIPSIAKLVMLPHNICIWRCG